MYPHVHADTHTIPAFAPSLLHSSLSSFSLSCFKSCWTGLGRRWFLCGTVRSLLWLWHHTPTPWCVIYLHRGQLDSRGLPHSSTEAEGLLKAKPHPSQQSVLCTVPHRGILWENIDYFILIIVGEDGRTRGGDVGDWMGCECHRGLGSIHLTGDSHHTWFLVRPQAEFIGISISCMQTLACNPTVHILLWTSYIQSSEVSAINSNRGNKPAAHTIKVWRGLRRKFSG